MVCLQADEFERSSVMLNYYYTVKYLKKTYPKVWAAFVAVCESTEWAEEAIESGPKIEFVDKIPGASDCASGLFQPRFGSGKLIFISAETARLFEKDPANHYKLQAVALHECVHYARYWADKDVVWFHEPSGAMTEAGKAFELRAYGRVINPFTDTHFEQCLINSKHK